jgi:hypothetical protein
MNDAQQLQHSGHGKRPPICPQSFNCLGFGMVAGDGDSSRKTKHKHNKSESDGAKKKSDRKVA